jgi:hypothetical protein
LNTGAWFGLLVTAVVLFAVLATLVPRIRQHRAEQAHAKAMDEFHNERDFVQISQTDVQHSETEPINSSTHDARRRLARW